MFSYPIQKSIISDLQNLFQQIKLRTHVKDETSITAINQTNEQVSLEIKSKE